MLVFCEYFFRYSSNPNTVSEKVVWISLLCNIFFQEIDLSKIEQNRMKIRLVVLKLNKSLILCKIFHKILIRLVNL